MPEEDWQALTAYYTPAPQRGERDERARRQTAETLAEKLGAEIGAARQASAGARTEKKERPNPPGTVFLKDSLYIDKTEVSVGQWKEFQKWAKVDSSGKFKAEALLPDTLIWYDVTPPYGNSGAYFWYEGFNKHPIVGIT